MSENGDTRLPRRLIRVLLWAAGGSLAVTVALPWLLPFLLALAIAAMLEPAVAALIRLGLPRWGAAAACTAGLAGALGGGMALCLWRIAVEASDLLDRLPLLLGRLEGPAGWLVALPPTLRPLLEQVLEDLSQQVGALPQRISQWLGQGLAGLACALPGGLLFVFTTVLATYFTSAGRPALLRFLARQLPQRWQERLEEVKRRLREALGGWLRAQGLLLLVTFGEVLLGLLVLGARQALLLALLTALVDALPVFGAGTVLVPWAAGCLLAGRPAMALGLLALYGLVSLVRSFLEPKLLGDRMGLPPLAALCAMYVGFRAFGVAGMILSPLALTLLKQLHHCGLVRLWRD